MDLLCYGIDKAVQWMDRVASPGYLPSDSADVKSAKFFLTVSCVLVIVYSVPWIVLTMSPWGGVAFGAIRVALTVIVTLQTVLAACCYPWYIVTKDHVRPGIVVASAVTLAVYSSQLLYGELHPPQYLIADVVVMASIILGLPRWYTNVSRAGLFLVVFIFVLGELDILPVFTFPRPPLRSQKFVYLLLCLNNHIGPMVAGFILTYLFVMKVDASKRELQSAIDLTGKACEHIARMQLDAADSLLQSARPTSMEKTLLLIVQNLKAYTPYLPGHVLHQAAEEHDDSGDDEPQHDTVVSSPTLECRSSSVPSHRNSIASTSLSIDGAASQDVVARLNVPVRRQAVTLLAVKLSGMQPPRGSNPFTLPSLFLQLLTDVTVSSGGVLHQFNVNTAVVVWNASPASRVVGHVAKACSAALQLKELVDPATSTGQELEHQGGKECQLLMGVWTGVVQVGTYGSNTNKALGILGGAVEAALWLRDFSHHWHGAILCCLAVRRAVDVHYNFRLVDVVGSPKSDVKSDTIKDDLHTVVREGTLSKPALVQDELTVQPLTCPRRGGTGEKPLMTVDSESLHDVDETHEFLGGTPPGGIHRIFELVCEYRTSEDEWMYQLREAAERDAYRHYKVAMERLHGGEHIQHVLNELHAHQQQLQLTDPVAVHWTKLLIYAQQNTSVVVSRVPYCRRFMPEWEVFPEEVL